MDTHSKFLKFYNGGLQLFVRWLCIIGRYGAKFALIDETTSTKTHKRKFFCISFFVLIIVIGILSAFIYWKVFLTPYEQQSYFSLKENVSTETTLVGLKSVKSNLFTKKLWSPKVETCLELTYSDVESQNYLSAVFGIHAQENLKISLTSVYGYINMDLFLYYDRIVNKYDMKNLKVMFENFQKDLQGSRDILKFLNKLELEKFKFYVKYLKGNQPEVDFKYFSKFVKLTDEFQDWYMYLENLRSFLSLYEQQKYRKEYYEISDGNFLEFTKRTQEIMQSVAYIFNVTEKKLFEVNKIVKEWMKPPRLSFENCSIIINGKVLLISELKSQLKTLNESSVKRLYLFASHTVYLDDDLIAPGVDVAIIAPRWVFLRKININLSGREGSEFLIKTATEGNAGKPGNPGENSGDFIGIGDMNTKFLILTTNGGNGGDGQSGARGRDGANETRPAPPVDKPICIDKIRHFKNYFGQPITHYKIFNENGCGSSGTDGGAGGIGGKGGRVVLINTDNMIVTVRKGFDGLNGSSGDGGEGGIGGQNGCFYEVFDVDDQILHKVTTVKCQLNVLPSGKSGKPGGNIFKLTPPSTKQNLSLTESFFSFYKTEEKNLMEFNDTVTASFLKKLIESDLIYNLTTKKNVLTEFDILSKFPRIDLIQSLKNKIDAFLLNLPKDNFLNYVKTLILARILEFQKNKHYHFIDIESYLNEIEKRIKDVKGNVTKYSLSKISENAIVKLMKISENLNAIKSDLTALESKCNKSAKKFLMSANVSSNFYKNLAFALEERRILYITQMLADLMIRFVNLIQNPPFHDKEFKNFLARYSLYYNEMQRKKEKFFNSLNDLTSSQKQILSQIVIRPGEFEEHAQIITKVISFVSDFLHEEKKLANILENFSDEKNFAKEIKYIAESFSESKALSVEGKILLQALTDELDHFMALYYYIEREKMEKSFLKSLNNLNFDSEELKNENKLKDVIISMEYNLAVDAVQLKVQPIKSLENLRLSTENIANEALFYINHLRTMSRQNTICKNFREGIFDKTSVLGDFYYWSNSEVKNKLKRLFMGETISLKSSLKNPHILDKNFIKFKLLKLEFDNRNSSLHNILNNFQIELTHSGYSYYNWKGESYVIISEEVTLEYGFKTNSNGEPEVYNNLFKKLQSGEFMLSPYTTWMVRLSPIKNTSKFSQLMYFVNTTALRLTGTGTFIS